MNSQSRADHGPNADAHRGTVPHPLQEQLLADDRAGLTPSEMVERKLVALLRGGPLPVSKLQAHTARRPTPSGR